jgi:hypothetical protein
MKTKPEWPEPRQKSVVWEFGRQQATVYDCHFGSVYSRAVKLISVMFSQEDEYRRAICIRCMNPRARKSSFAKLYDWFYERPWAGPDYQPFERGDGWLVIAKGYHPLESKPIISYGGMVHSGYEPITIEAFNAWLKQKNLELLIDFREVAIAEGWRPGYCGCATNPPAPPPPELRHWYPEFEQEETRLLHDDDVPQRSHPEVLRRGAR